jgi:GNAT superfamily N-acetyltransferase
MVLNRVTGIDIAISKTMPARSEIDPILRAYYETVVQRMRAGGFDVQDSAPQSALREFWDHSDDYLPPRGCIALARNAAGATVGIGMLKCLDPETGELKRLFVTEQARGTGAGRRLVEARIGFARTLGLKRLVADTLRTNVEMRRLYPRLGFVESATPIETTTYRDQPMLRPFMHYFTLSLDAH